MAIADIGRMALASSGQRAQFLFQMEQMKQGIAERKRLRIHNMIQNKIAQDEQKKILKKQQHRANIQKAISGLAIVAGSMAGGAPGAAMAAGPTANASKFAAGGVPDINQVGFANLLNSQMSNTGLGQQRGSTFDIASLFKNLGGS